MKLTAKPGPISVWRTMPVDRFMVGAPHYPEHVSRDYWDRDAVRMAAAGFNTVRMAEFAWHLMEPREGVFDFSLFDDAIAGLARQGINTILCTPTATPPRWLTTHYPEVLRVEEGGRTMSHGSRQHADTASPVFRAHSQRITRAMAEHYRDNPHVIGWQTDNELNTSTSGSWGPVARREFQTWCEARYGTIDALNAAWGGDFWATAYDNFDQIVLPLNLAPVAPSPGHVQDHRRYLAHATARFQHDQVVILRQTNPDWFIFHNLGRQEDIDFRGTFSNDLDFLGFDFYPFLHDELWRIGGHALAQAFSLAISRGHTGNFFIPEQQSGMGAHPSIGTMTPEPGEMRRMAWSSVARGADGLLFFRWRPAHFGAEIYWMGIIDHDDVPRRRYDEAHQFATEVTALAPALLGTHVAMDVAIAGSDFDNEHAHRAYPIGLPNPLEDALVLYRHCYAKGYRVGFIHPEDDLVPLKLLYVPHWVIWPHAWTARIEAFAEAGGTVVFGARTGTRDASNHVIRETAPGERLSVLAGVRVEEFGRIATPGADGLFNLPGVGVGPRHPTTAATRRYTMRIGNQTVEAGHLYEILQADAGTEVIGTWSNRFAEGQAAITRRKVGKGQVVYLGTYLTDALMPVLFDDLLAQANAEPILPNLPSGVEVSERVGGGQSLVFVVNTTDQPVVVASLPTHVPLLTDSKALAGALHLPGYGCAVLHQIHETVTSD
jgi:beta-galactosidase